MQPADDDEQFLWSVNNLCKRNSHVEKQEGYFDDFDDKEPRHSQKKNSKKRYPYPCRSTLHS